MNGRLLASATVTMMLITSPCIAAASAGPMGIAIGNLLVGDYGAQGKVTGAFDSDGTVALTFPDGSKRTQRWVADANYFCMIASPGSDGKFSYRCERNMINGKKLGESWKQVDSEGLPVTISIVPRP
jgi:hypothetical protein